MIKIPASVLALLLSSVVCAQDLSTVRLVNGNSLKSESDPALLVELPGQVSYVGGDRWILFEVADCELHVFVETDNRKEISRLYWIQFEAYLPERPELRYEYTDPNKVTVAGMEFFAMTNVGPTTSASRPGSDNERVQKLLLAAGYKVPPEMMSVRLVHLLDNRRRELMLIYAEDLAVTGFSAAQLAPGGLEQSRWQNISDALTQRAIGSVSFHKLD